MRGKNPTDSLSEADKVGGGGSEVKRGGKKKIWSKPKAHAGWPKRVKLVWATPRAEVDVIGVH